MHTLSLLIFFKHNNPNWKLIKLLFFKNYLKTKSVELNTMNQLVHIRTAIIGAGASGISAAVTLLNNKYDQFLVFEGLERIGGRIHTQTDGKKLMRCVFNFCRLVTFLKKQ
jgi:heterodisulfide reductase subunit A-like polyferredoxin